VHGWQPSYAYFEAYRGATAEKEVNSCSELYVSILNPVFWTTCTVVRHTGKLSQGLSVARDSY